MQNSMVNKGEINVKMSSLNIVRYRAVFIIIVTVLTNAARTSHGQSYLLTLSQHQRHFYSGEELRESSPPLPPQPQPPSTSTSSPTITAAHSNHSEKTLTIRANAIDAEDSDEDNNTAIIVIKNIHQRSTELSETAMDVITIVWYVATFLALAAFFLLMACSDRRCADSQRSSGAAPISNSTPVAPPTPSPSYSEFAPPSYESVIKLQQHDAVDSGGDGIFVIPLTVEGGDKDANNSLVAPPAVNFYTINELNKLSSGV